MTRAFWMLVLAAMLCSGQGQTINAKAMLTRLSEEADAFRRIAPSLLGRENLEQKAHKPAARFRPRVGKDAMQAAPVVWQDRQIVSEYGFISFPGDADTLHELRRVLSVDGKSISDAKKDEESLARVISLKDEARERELLKEFEKYGLVGAVTDFGPLLMLFTPREIEHFEFAFARSQFVGASRALIFRYAQLDGPELLTIFESTSKGKPYKTRVAGEIWVREGDYLPLRITVAVGQGGSSAVREEAAVDYSPSSFGTLVPTAVEHKELVRGQLNVQNSFVYTDFHKFGADAQIKFTSTP